MAQPRLDKHSGIHHELFDENTAQVGSVGDIVEQHAGDAIFLTPKEKSIGGADGGETDFESEMLETDPADDEGINPDDLYSEQDEDAVWATDQTGTVEGIARGFGTHLPQDIGRAGFQIEEIPDSALKYNSRAVEDGEELDDYDDNNQIHKYDSSPSLSRASEPGANEVRPGGDHEPTPDRIPIQKRRARDSDQELDATGNMT